MVAGMAVREYDLVFVGGGLATLLFLREPEPTLPDRVAICRSLLAAGVSDRPLELLEPGGYPLRAVRHRGLAEGQGGRQAA